MRARSLAPWLFAVLPFVAFPAPARAEDETPAGEEKKPEKPTKDDMSIFKDFKLAQARGISYRLERAKFWAEKGVASKDLYFLGRFFQIGEDYPKAVEYFEKYFAWDPSTDAAVEEKDRESLVSAKTKNAEFARKELMEIHLRMKEFKKVVEAAQRYRADYPNGGATSDSHDQEGRAQRMDGNVDAAVASFKAAADAGFAKGLLDLVELLMAEGKYAEAKTAADQAVAGELGKNPVVKAMADFAAAANGGGPTLEKLVSVGRSETPALAGKPVLFYLWHMQAAVIDRKLALLDRDVQKPLGDKAVVVGLATYNRYNPEVSKVEEGMTQEAEIDWYKKFAEKFDMRSVSVAPKDVLDALHLRYEQQMVVVDAEGKLRWMRIGKDEPYDRFAAELALRKVAEPPAK